MMPPMIAGWSVAVAFLAALVLLVIKHVKTIAKMDALVVKVSKLKKEVARLTQERSQFAMVAALERNERILAQHLRLTETIDDKTQSLIRLAVSNPEKNEGSTAALVACKRLKKALDT